MDRIPDLWLRPPRGVRPRDLGIRACLGAAALAAVCPAGGAEPQPASVQSIPLGAARIDVITWDYPPPAGGRAADVVVCSLHDDENTAVEAAAIVLAERGGRLTEVRHSGAREVVFRLDGHEFRFDPNRIFTPAGRRATLEKLSAWTPEADEAVRAFADHLAAAHRLTRAATVVAVHNNTPDRYTVRDYLPGGPLAADAADVAVHAGVDPDDFFYVTDRGLFEALSAKGRQVVLQAEASVADDGSLSVACGKNGIRYVNVEAEHGHRAEQAAMLRDLLEILDAMPPAPPAAPVPPGLELVDLAAVDPTLVIDARYATADNPAAERLYPANVLYLERSAADRLARVQAGLRRRGLGLKVFDGYRPLAVQKALWKAMPDPRYVADPATGSRHNRGSAVDVTLVDESGRELPMPTAFDEFNERAHLDYHDGPPDRLANRGILQEAMRAEGFIPLATEWWHFDAPEWERFPVMDLNPWPAALFPDRRTGDDGRDSR
ncbi:MAG: M15 family metallopeptidase [Planctomycetaceae bacterium]